MMQEADTNVGEGALRGGGALLPSNSHSSFEGRATFS